MKNKLTDLNDYLFVQLDRLSEEGLSAEAIALEVKRAEAMVRVADTIVINARLQLDGCKLLAEHGDKFGNGLRMITGPSTESKA